MDEATPTASPFSTAPISLLLSAKGGASHAQKSSKNCQQLDSDTNGDFPYKISMMTSSGESPAAALEMAEESAIKGLLKRARTVDEDDKNASPVPRKAAREAKMETESVGMTSPPGTKAPNEIIANDSGHQIGDLAEFEKPANMTRTRPKPIPKKKVVKSTRSRVCATCKRRKVKCKHNPVDEEAGDECSTLKGLSLAGSADDVEKTPKPMQAQQGNGPVNAGAPAVDQVTKQEDVANDYDTPLEEEPPKKSKAEKKAAPKKASAPPERTSTRNRKAPERFESLQERPLLKASPTRRGSSKVFDPVYITTNSTSRLGKADMYHMLTDDDTAWTSLSAEQQATLVSMLPETTEHQQLLAKIRAGETEGTRPQYLKASDVFRTEIAKFQADLTNGHLAKTWQAVAEQAVVERAAGEYDAWKAEEAELWWGQKSR